MTISPNDLVLIEQIEERMLSCPDPYWWSALALSEARYIVNVPVPYILDKNGVRHELYAQPVFMA